MKTEVVTPEYFSLLEVKPLLGRTFLPEDGRRGAAPVVMLSENLWRDRLGADPRILGKSITLDKRPFTVVGVMPGTFRSPVFIEEPRDIWIPMVQDPLFSGLMTLRNRPGFGILARLRPGASGAQAQAEMDAIGKRMTFGFPPKGKTSREIVGIVGDVRDVSLHQEPGPMMYVPFAQAPFWGL